MVEPAVPVRTNNRRFFLKKSWWLIKIAAIGVVLYPVLRFVNFYTPKKPREIMVHKELSDGEFIIEHEFILFQREQGVWAVSRKCTHLGCRLNYSEEKNRLICPCHQSKFTIMGEMVRGPAKKDLPIFQVVAMVESEGKGYIVTVL